MVNSIRSHEGRSHLGIFLSLDLVITKSDYDIVFLFVKSDHAAVHFYLMLKKPAFD